MTRWQRIICTTRAAALATAAVFAVACQPQPSSTVAIPVERSDSAGVPRYRLTELPAWNDPDFAWTLEAERSIPTTAGAPGSDPLIYQPQGYARLPDGRLAVLDGWEQRLAIVSISADLVESRFGPSGQGPGEILSSNAVLWPAGADELWVLDPGNARVSRFGLDGALRAERPVDIPGVGGYVMQRPSTHEPFLWKVFYQGVDGGLLTDSVGRFDAELGRVIYFAALPARVEARRRRGAPATLFAAMGWFAPVRSGVVVGRSDRARFWHYSDDGQLLGIIEAPMNQAPIPKSAEPEILAEFYGELRGPSAQRPVEIAESYPLWNVMWPVDDTLFALQQSHRSTPAGEPEIPQGQMVWRIFSVHGHYAGAIVFPEGVAQPYWIENGRIVGTHRDELGVATIESYEVHPPTR
jgi:hypothetical protein